MALSFLQIIAGRINEVLFTVLGGTANANKAPMLNGSGQLDITMFPPGFGPDADTFTATEAIAANAWVNINRAAGTMRNASAAGIGTRADAYVINAVAANAVGTAMFDDNNSGFTGLTTTDYYLSITPGQGVPITGPLPTGAGVISQRLGVAVSATTIHASIGEPYILAQ